MLIKNIVFDLGNVILNINPDLSVKAFAEMGITGFDKLYTLSLQTTLFDALETGNTSSGLFCEEIRKITNIDLPDKQIIDAWNALILDFLPENLSFLKTVKTQYRTFILSNTNRIHYDFYSEKLRKEHEVQSLESLVEKAFFSHEVGMRKPEEGIFKLLIKNTGIDQGDTLFIDDSATNCIAASKLGFWTHEYKEENLPALFRKLNLPF